MDLLFLKECLGNIAVATTILQFLSGILICKQYVIKKTTGEASALPFVCGALSCGLWLMYGLSKQDSKIVFVNTVGVLLMLLYIAIFYIFTFKKTETSKLVVITFICYIFLNGYVFTEEDSELLLNRLGTLACSLTLLTIAAPMSKLFYVIKVKCTECLPFPLILMTFFVCSFWSLYGWLDEDVYLSVRKWQSFMMLIITTRPNIIGALIALSQLSLFVIYPNTPYKISGSESICLL